MAASEKAAERPLTAQERLKLRLEELKQHREDLVHNAMAIMADPDNEIARLQAFEPLTPARDPQKLSVAFLTQCMVYRDIIPGYRIRIVTDAEREGKISKEVRRQRQYEETLLRHYQNFLKSLSVALDAPSSPPTLKHVVLTCLCNLLEHASHFNFRFNIISPVTKLLSQIVADALIHMFEEDHTGEISKEAIRIMADEGKRRHNRIPEPLIRATFHLRVRSEMPSALAILNQSREAEAERKRKEHEAERKKTGALHKSKRIKKHEKANSDINQELREADAVVHHEERLAHHRETLKYLFVIYFRIIKTQQESKLFPVVLEGLTMFAHLINIEFFSDIFAVLKKLLVTSESARTITASGGGERHDVDASPRIGLESRLFCVISMIKMLHIQGQALNEDPTQIITALYTITLDVMMQPNGQLVYRLQTMLLSALDLMFLSRRQNMADRLAAFIKRLASTAMQADAPVALGILALVRQLIIKYPALLALLEPDEEARVGMGGFQPEVDQPELANAFATSLWELVELTAHWHPIVGEYATQLLKQARAGSEALRQAGGAAPQRIAQSQLSLRAMPQHLQPTWDQMLVNYETCRATFSTFRLTPRFTLNAAQKRKLQRKGIWFGPAVTAEPSDFLSELKAQTES
ncbi:hypothetical protein CXG81DRAFT_10501 [Caulochytrium protostelioides]|uniref:Nucleolar complex-associated protein 3 n=1 Tax=Caulochytrium protostelioides TaxID=1555241 RepID=A0A4P9XBA5_9FUNG|nr:hypothetical protein CXG81DRAFT_10501 [Caulochytrium protostelioides]|eukprot:RKP02694.1 hypothetical protein CXG81DRAFT_10501 [Caulochytrium protostelioides]